MNGEIPTHTNASTGKRIRTQGKEMCKFMGPKITWPKIRRPKFRILRLSPIAAVRIVAVLVLYLVGLSLISSTASDFHPLAALERAAAPQDRAG